MDKIKRRRFIFLDIDGVLNHDKWYKYLHDNLHILHPSNLSFGKVNLCPYSVKLLNKLKGCEVIISSSWTLKTAKVSLMDAGLELPIIGCTEHKSLCDKAQCRGNDIARWFIDNIYKEPPLPIFKNDDGWYHFNNQIFQYVIFDDWNDMLMQQFENFIHVNSKKGLEQKHIDKAKKILMLCD